MALGLLVTFMAVFLLHYTLFLRRRVSDERRAIRLEEAAPEHPSSPAPSLSVVVPARNEERHLPQCLESLSRLEYDPLEIIVVDDRSSDATRDIALSYARKDPRFKVIEGKEPPTGWTGKNFAIHQGAQGARGAFLLIVDADTTLAPETARRAVAYMEAHSVDLLSLYPQPVCSSFWEKTLLPLMGVLSIFRMNKVNDPRSKEAMAFGYFLLFRRSSFDAIGGYEAIKDRVGEDWIIARKVKGSGLTLRMLLGNRFVRKRFGPTLFEIWQGFTKNLILTMEGRRWVALLAIPLVIYQFFLMVCPWVFLVLAPVILCAGGWNPLWFLVLVLAASQCLVVMATRVLLNLFLGLEVSRPYLQVLGGVVLTGMGLVAATRTLFGKGIAWKGRVYRTF